jgi:hypothetical protein
LGANREELTTLPQATPCSIDMDHYFQPLNLIERTCKQLIAGLANANRTLGLFRLNRARPLG